MSMRHAPTRSAALSSTAATTLVTLVAMAATMPSLPRLAAAPAPGSVRAAVAEPGPVRLVAAAVAAAARELIGPEHAPLGLASIAVSESIAPAAAAQRLAAPSSPRGRPAQLSLETLIDRPPPGC